MPEVKKKRAAAKRKPAKTPAKRSKKRDDNRSARDRLTETLAAGQRLATAATAGSVILVLTALIILWAGGYVGVVVENIDRSAKGALVAVGAEIEKIDVRGARETTLAEVTDAVGPILGESLLHLNLDAARARIENLGWVRSAAVTRLWPNTVNVSIRERRPAAVWQLAGSLYLIDEAGAIIREVSLYEYAQLPMIVGAGAPEAASTLLAALRSTPVVGDRTTALVRVGRRRWDLQLKNKVEVRLPERDVEDALDALSIMHRAHGTLDRDLEYIDLRDPTKVAVFPSADGS
ncbi:MAG: cell division protein FtsQ/DivIB [Pseudomonadota bacterium]